MSELRSKDPDSTVDYTFDWTDWLGTDTITTATVTVTSGVTVVGPPTWTGSKVTCWLTGGILGATARVVCHISTAAGRTEDQTLVLAIRQH